MYPAVVDTVDVEFKIETDVFEAIRFIIRKVIKI